MQLDHVFNIIESNETFCNELYSLYPEVENIIILYKSNPNNDVVRNKLSIDIKEIMNSRDFIDLIQSNLINNIKSSSIIGNVYKINSNPKDFKKFMKHVRYSRWEYNTFSVLEKDGKWLIFFA
jgi:hypothetical protein